MIAKLKLFSLILPILMLCACENSTNYVQIADKKIAVEIADDNSERLQGLQNRENLCPKCGMLFVYENDRGLSFWMKDTLIPLDIVFINSDLQVVDLHHAQPCADQPCPKYSSKEPAQYVLEANANTFSEDIIGQKAEIVITESPS